MAGTSFYEAVWAVVRGIPRGRVVAYGHLATWLGSPRAARAVGYAMFNVPDDSVPWHRVINSRGEISLGGEPYRAERQRRLLELEGVEFDGNGRVNFKTFGWSPSSAVIARAMKHTTLVRRGKK